MPCWWSPNHRFPASTTWSGFWASAAIFKCVNKWDINPENTEKIETFCQREGCPVIGKVPFDPIVTKAMVMESTVVEYTGGIVAQEIKKMWTQLERLLGYPLDAKGALRGEQGLNV
jgi:hypothetical protein